MIFANSLHLLSEEHKEQALAESWRVLKPGGVIAINSTFYDGAYPEESKPFYSRWIRRSIVEINRRLPNREKGEQVQAMEFLPADDLPQADQGRRLQGRRDARAPRPAQPVGRARDQRLRGVRQGRPARHRRRRADEASAVLQATVQQTFRDLKMKYLPRIWLEIIAVKASPATS